MFWMSACIGFAFVASPSGDAPGAWPEYPGVHAVRVKGGSGEYTTFVFPPGTPPGVRAAFKAVEFAERDVALADQLQQLKLDYVRRERTLDALAAHRATFGPGNATLAGPPYGAFPYYSNYPPPARASFPVNAFRSSSGGGQFGQSPFASNPALKQALAFTLASEATAERAALALERMVAAHAKAAEALRTYHAAAKPRTASNPTRREATAQTSTREGAAKKLREADAERATTQAELAVLAEGVVGRREREAERRERESLKAERAAADRYRSAEPDDRDAARAAWVSARDGWANARRDWDAARTMWEETRDLLPAAPDAKDPSAAATQGRK